MSYKVRLLNKYDINQECCGYSTCRRIDFVNLADPSIQLQLRRNELVTKKKRISVDQKKFAQAAQTQAEAQLRIAKSIELKLKQAVADNAEVQVKALSLALAEQLSVLEDTVKQAEEIVLHTRQVLGDRQ